MRFYLATVTTDGDGSRNASVDPYPVAWTAVYPSDGRTVALAAVRATDDQTGILADAGIDALPNAPLDVALGTTDATALAAACTKRGLQAPAGATYRAQLIALGKQLDATFSGFSDQAFG